MTTIWCTGYPIEVPVFVNFVRLRVYPSGPNSNKKTIRRYRLWIYGNKRCTYCKRPLEFKNSTIDHIVPRSKGGTNIGNLTISCKKCNHTKNNMPVEEFLNSSFLRKRICND